MLKERGTKYKQAKYTLEKEIRVAKRNYSGKLRNSRLNESYCRFEKTSHTRPEHLSTQPLTPPATPLSPTPALQISEDDMCQVFKRSKAPGPDGVSPACLKICADQLTPIFTQIVNRSLLMTADQQISCAKSPYASNAPPSSPSQRNPKLLDLRTTDLWL